MTANLNFLATFILVALMLPSGAFGQVPPAVTGETVVVMTHPPDPLERRQTTTDETVVVMTPPKVYPSDPPEGPRTTTVRPVRPLPATTLMPDKLVMTLGNGGWIDEHRMLFEGYRRSGTRVELRGPCYSACTMITAYVAKDKLCIAPGTFFAFHAARAGEGNSQQLVPETTAQMYRMQPPEIRNWIDHNGGHDKLPLHGFWTMYDRELWAMGYPQCPPINNQ
jgi:hypothetical protein